MPKRPGRQAAALLFTALLLDACASPDAFGAAWRAAHPGFAPVAPAPGQPFGEAIASLGASPDGRHVEVVELRVLRLAPPPWTAIAPEQAVEAPGRVGVVVGRSCKERHGLSTDSSLRGSWLLFEDGALRAFDVDAFAAACTPEPRYQPAPGRLAADERGLARYVAQRYPRTPADVEAQVQRALRLVDVGRLEEAEESLQMVDRDIAEVRERLLRPEDWTDEELRAMHEQEQRLRADRAQLWHRIQEARKRAPDDLPPTN